METQRDDDREALEAQRRRIQQNLSELQQELVAVNLALAVIEAERIRAIPQEKD